MVNKKDEPPPSARKRYAFSASRASSVEKHNSNTATGAGTSSASVSASPSNGRASSLQQQQQSGIQMKKLGPAPKSNESPLKQALVIHHANVQQISVNWFKLFSEQMEAMRKEREGKQANGGGRRMSKSATEFQSESPQSSSAVMSVSETEFGVAKVESVRLVKQSQLIHPTEVKISQHAVQDEARLLLTPMEATPDHVKQYDKAIKEAMIEKNEILSQMFGLSKDDLEKVSDSISENHHTQDPDARLLVLASMIQTDRLLTAINSNLRLIQDTQRNSINPKASPRPSSRSPSPRRVKSSTAGGSGAPDPPAVPCRQLALIVPPLLKHLSSLLQTIKHTEDDLKVARGELIRFKSESGSMENSMHGALSNRSSRSDT